MDDTHYKIIFSSRYAPLKRSGILTETTDTGYVIDGFFYYAGYVTIYSKEPIIDESDDVRGYEEDYED